MTLSPTFTPPPPHALSTWPQRQRMATTNFSQICFIRMSLKAAPSSLWSSRTPARAASRRGGVRLHPNPGVEERGVRWPRGKITGAMSCRPLLCCLRHLRSKPVSTGGGITRTEVSTLPNLCACGLGSHEHDLEPASVTSPERHSGMVRYRTRGVREEELMIYIVYWNPHAVSKDCVGLR
jgi:hypothetical protein